MDEVLHANVFFFITGIAVIVFSAILCIAFFHVIKALKTIRRILESIEKGAEVITEDMQNMRAYFTGEGFMARLIQIVTGGARSKKPRSGKTAQQEKKKTELRIKNETR